MQPIDISQDPSGFTKQVLDFLQQATRLGITLQIDLLFVSQEEGTNPVLLNKFVALPRTEQEVKKHFDDLNGKTVPTDSDTELPSPSKFLIPREGK